MVKHVMCRRAHGSTSMIIPRRPGRRGNIIVTCPAARLAGLAWLAGAARLAAAAAPLTLKVGLHANAFLLSSAIATPCILLIQPIASTTLFHAAPWIIGFIPFPFLLFQTKTVVVPGVPVGVHFHMQLACTSGFFIVFLLFFPGQIVPPSP